MTELERYAQALLRLINRDRQRSQRDPVAWDTVAASAALRHAQDMAHNGYCSHWDQEGHGPEYRYIQAGGLDAVSEIVFTFSKRDSDGSPLPIHDWWATLEEGQDALMQTLSHRRNALDPAHTHVGIGLAYAPQAGQFWLTHEFVNRYVRLNPVPRRAALGHTIQVAGQLLPGAQAPLINLAYAVFPKPMPVAVLNRTGAYQPSTKLISPIRPENLPDGQFGAPIKLDYKAGPGLYYIRVWVEQTATRQSVLAAELVVEVQ